MAGRVWRSRPIRRGDYEFEVTGPDSTTTSAVFVSMQHGVDRPSLLAQRILATIAEHHADTVAGTPGIDWAALGWADQTEHDGIVAGIAEIVQAWRGHPAEFQLRTYVTTEKARTGVPVAPPYSLAQADELDRIVRRAPQVVAQDLAAEGSAA